MKKLAAEFKEFLLKQNALALAVGVIIGGALGKIVSGLVDDLIMPIVGLALPGGDWRSAQLSLGGSAALKYGDLFGRAIDFVIAAAGGFGLVKARPQRPPPGATKSRPACLGSIPAAARR